MSSTIYGIIPPTTTPFSAAGDVDTAALRRQVRFLIDQRVHGLAVGGSTGEGHTLSRRARRLTRGVFEPRVHAGSPASVARGVSPRRHQSVGGLTRSPWPCSAGAASRTSRC